MVWDFAELAPFGDASGNVTDRLANTCTAIGLLGEVAASAAVTRGSAKALPWPDASFDAVITDPPYYDNVDYAKLADFFYIWLKRTIGPLYPEHFTSAGTPKKQEIVADPVRHGGSKEKARAAYEQMMAQSLAEAHRVLKPGGTIVVVYAHKTTLGWSTLVDALRQAGFTVTEAWPIDTERKARLIAMETAALASSIFLVGRKRESALTPSPHPPLPPGEGPGVRERRELVGSYEDEVRPDLERIVRERVETLWEQGISGADLVIACVGAGLRAFTRFARVEYANGEEVPAERFLAEVETVVLDSILRRLSKEVGGTLTPSPYPPLPGGEGLGVREREKETSLAGVDPATRFYVLWRYTYRSAELDAGEAIIFANGTHVELDGPAGLSSGARALVEKKKGKYRLRDYTERGADDKLGMPEDGQPAPLIDALHRTLWLMEHRPLELAKFLQEAEPNREQMRLVAQALAGPALKGGELADVSPSAELSALAKLTANWRSVIEDNVFTPSAQADRKRGQQRMFE
jgi:putative DNA methylase